MKLNLFLLARRNSVFIYIIIFFAFLALGLLVEGSTVFYAIGFLITMVLIYAISILYSGLSKKNKNFFLPTVFTINDECVIEKTSISENMYKWDVFIKWEKITTYYMLYLSRITFLAIPEVNIRTGDIPAFTHLLETHIGAQAGRIWSWKMRGALYPAILLSLSWLFILVMLSFAAPEHADKTPVIVTLAGMFLIIILFTMEFYFIVRGKKSGNRMMTYIASGLLLLTIVVIISILIYFMLHL